MTHLFGNSTTMIIFYDMEHQPSLKEESSIFQTRERTSPSKLPFSVNYKNKPCYNDFLTRFFIVINPTTVISITNHINNSNRINNNLCFHCLTGRGCGRNRRQHTYLSIFKKSVYSLALPPLKSSIR